MFACYVVISIMNIIIWLSNILIWDHILNHLWAHIMFNKFYSMELSLLVVVYFLKYVA